MAKSRKSLFGWLGRQIGYVSGGVKKDVTPPTVLYQKTVVQEAPLANRPDEKLRRTVVDEVVREPKRIQGATPVSRGVDGGKTKGDAGAAPTKE